MTSSKKFLRYVRKDIDTDQIGEAEGTHFRPAEDCASQGIDLLDREIHGLHQANGVQHGEGTDAIGDEVRGVFGEDDGFAEALFGEIGDSFEGGGIGFGGGNEFQQAHIARGIKEMGAKPVAAEFGIHAFGDLMHRKAAGIGCDDCVFAAEGADFLRVRRV